jgi:hypothetical protein
MFPWLEISYLARSSNDSTIGSTSASIPSSGLVEAVGQID